jgi:hypothetical protein
MQVQDVLNNALEYIGAYAPGETPNANDQATALFWANVDLDLLSAKKLSPLGLANLLAALSGAASYTFGPGQTWNTARPVKIKSASTVAANGIETSIEIVSAEQWTKIRDKTRVGLFVKQLLWDAGYPAGNIFVTPKPAAGNVSLWMYVPIVQFVNLTDTVNLSPGFADCVIKRLALNLVFPFGRPMPDGLPQLAADALTTIAELQADILGSSPPVGGQSPMPPPPGPKE